MRTERERMRAVRPSCTVPAKKAVHAKPIGVQELARRYENGLDLWTGKPLRGQSAARSRTLKKAWDRATI